EDPNVRADVGDTITRLREVGSSQSRGHLNSKDELLKGLAAATASDPSIVSHVADILPIPKKKLF
ncbi:hypothetical protein SARC_17566, partial [Sphaeroforma arctica JP610]